MNKITCLMKVLHSDVSDRVKQLAFMFIEKYENKHWPDLPLHIPKDEWDEAYELTLPYGRYVYMDRHVKSVIPKVPPGLYM